MIILLLERVKNAVHIAKYLQALKVQGGIKTKNPKCIKALPEFHVLPPFDAAHPIVICKTFDS